VAFRENRDFPAADLRGRAGAMLRWRLARIDFGPIILSLYETDPNFSSSALPMADAPDFADFVRRIRAGDHLAAQELVTRFEPIIRREVRMRISDDRLNRVFDSLDVCQSVLANFFARAEDGQFEIERPDQLVRLLVTMARNKVASRVRQERRHVRDMRRVMGDPTVLDQLAYAGPSPSALAANKEEWDLLQTALTAEERQIAELRGEGLGWDEVATQMGGSGQARRMQLTRGIERLKRRRQADSGSSPC
jgi:RNA polymerase sigma factor (sigma-70 family)